MVMKALAILATIVASLSAAGLFVLIYLAIFLHSSTLGWAAYATGFLTVPVTAGLAFLASECADSGSKR